MALEDMKLMEAYLKYHIPCIGLLEKKMVDFEKLLSKSSFKIIDRAVFSNIHRYDLYVEGKHDNKYNISISSSVNIIIRYEQTAYQPKEIATKELKSLKNIIEKAFKENVAKKS